MSDAPRTAHPWGRRLGRACAVAALLWCALVGYRLLGVYAHARGAAQSARQVWQTRDAGGIVQPAPSQALRSQLGSFEAHVQGLARLVRPLACPLARQSLWPAAQRLGILGCDGLDLAIGLAATAWWGALELESAAAQYGQVTTAPGAPFVHAEDPLDRALTRLGRDRQRLLGLRPGAERLAAALGAFSWPLARLSTLAPLPTLAVDGLLLAPELLGGGQERLFLVVVQNSDELRATGGFISSVVALHMEGYRLLSLDYMNSYDVETEGYLMPPAPQPLQTYMLAPGLVFRDANWSPDWPTSAQVLAALYQASRGETVHGVVALDTALLRLALDATGPIPVGAYGVTITADNLLETAEAFWETPQEGASLAERTVNLWSWLQHRKDFGGVFIQAGQARLEQFSPRDWLRLATALGEGARRKHLQAWALENEGARQDLARAGWAGAIHRGEGDYLMVVDANVGYNKVDRNIERAISYNLSFADGAPVATLQLTYRNHATAELDSCIHEPQVLESYEALTQQCYWNYVRVLAPRGIELLDVTGGDHPLDVGQEQGRASLGTLLVVPPGQERTLTLAYRLPAEVVTCADGLCRYRLTVQKQAGAEATPLAVGANISPASLDAVGWERNDGALSLLTTLETDRTVAWSWRPATP
jgi:hypothetical protein